MSRSNEKGLVQIFLVLILLAGIALGVYLVGQRTNLFPKASVSAPSVPETSFTLVTDKNLFVVGEAIVVRLYARSEIDTANLFSAKLQFPLHLLEVVSISTTKPQADADSFVKNWVEQYYDHQTGGISLIGGVPSPGFKSILGEPWPLMAEITFKAKAAGTAVVLFEDSSAIYNNNDNINILGAKKPLTVDITSGGISPTPSPSSSPTAPGIMIYELPRQFTSTQGGNWFYYYKIGGSSESLLPPKQLPDTVVATTPPYEATYGSSNMKPKEWFGAGDNQYWHAGGSNWVMIDDGLNSGGDSQIALVYWQAPSAGTATITATDQRIEESGKGNGFEFGIGYAPGVGRLFSAILANKQVDSKDSSVQTLTFSQPMRGDGDALVYYKFSNNWTYGDTSRYSIKVAFTPSAVTIPSPSPITVVGSGDGNNDGKVNLADLSILLSNFNKTSDFPKPIDLNGDGKINSIDYGLMIQILIKAGVVKAGLG